MATSDRSTELIDIMCEYLDAGKFKEVLELPNDNKYADALKLYSWDLIPQLLNRIQDDTIIIWPALQRCCERLLLEIADRANPEEVLLELIEQTEGAKNDAQFIAILLPLQNVLKRLINKRGRSLEWCLNSVHSYIEALPLPEDYDFSDQESLLIDCDVNARRVVKIYSELPIFYNHFIKEAIKNQEKNPSAKKILLCFLIDLLGKPFALLDMSYNKTKSHCRVLVENIFKDIVTLEPNLFTFVQYVYRKCHPKTENSSENGVYEDAPTDIFLLEEKLKPVSLGVLYYLLLVEKQPVALLPQVYSSMYVSQELLYLSIFLLQQEENMLRQKGLQLAQALIDLLPDMAPSSLLSSSSHPTLAKILCTTAVYCPAEPLRKLAVVIIKKYILKFDNKGRYLFIVNLLPSLEHSGIKGYIISLYKEALMNAYQQGAEALSYFSGNRLRAMLSMACGLAEGAETNLVESADQIIAALNLLRFLVLRDTDNVTQVWDSIKNIQESFLDPLRNGLDMSRAHYEAKLLELDNGASGEKMESSPVSVSVDGSLLDSLSPEKKKEVVNAGLNALHLIDSVLCRLQECINSHTLACVNLN